MDEFARLVLRLPVVVRIVPCLALAALMCYLWWHGLYTGTGLMADGISHSLDKFGECRQISRARDCEDLSFLIFAIGWVIAFAVQASAIAIVIVLGISAQQIED